MSATSGSEMRSRTRAFESNYWSGQGVAATCQAFELALVRFWFQWTTPSAETAAADFEKAEVQIKYPRQFFQESLMSDLEAWVRAVTAVSSPTFRQRIEKTMVRRVDPELVQSPDELTKIDAEIDSAPAGTQGPGAEARDLRARANARLAGIGRPAAEGAA